MLPSVDPPVFAKVPGHITKLWELCDLIFFSLLIVISIYL